MAGEGQVTMAMRRTFFQLWEVLKLIRKKDIAEYDFYKYFSGVIGRTE